MLQIREWGEYPDFGVSGKGSTTNIRDLDTEAPSRLPGGTEQLQRDMQLVLESKAIDGLPPHPGLGGDLFAPIHEGVPPDNPDNGKDSIAPHGQHRFGLRDLERRWDQEHSTLEGDREDAQVDPQEEGSPLRGTHSRSLERASGESLG